MDTISKTVKLSATLRQIAAANEIEVRLTPEATVHDLLQTLSDHHPVLAKFVLASNNKLKPGIQLLVNGRHIDFLEGMDTSLDQAHTILLIPPIMGG